LTLPDAAANGSAMTKNAEPITVARKQPGRTMVTSAIAATALSSEARLVLTPPKLIKHTHKTVNNFLFMDFPFVATLHPVGLIFKLFILARKNCAAPEAAG
jgi:nitrate reductase gamma subunit